MYSTSYAIYAANGHGKDYEYDGRWKLIETLKNKEIIKISVGASHSMFLESNGILWGCGKNYFG